MRSRKTSRILNDDSYFLGLSYNDISSAGVLLLVLLLAGQALGIGSALWALAICSSVLAALIPVRLKYRRKIIRDSLSYLIFKGVNRVAKNH